MDSETFAELLTDTYQLDQTYVQHISMYLDSAQRSGFLDYIGVDYEEDE